MVNVAIPPGRHPAYAPLRHTDTVSALVATVPAALERTCLALLHRAARVSGMVETYLIIHLRHAAVPCCLLLPGVETLTRLASAWKPLRETLAWRMIWLGGPGRRPGDDPAGGSCKPTCG